MPLDRQPSPGTQALVIDGPRLQRLLDALAARGHRVIGPQVRDGAVVLGDLTTARDLPAGWGEVQDGGAYRLTRRDDGALFGWSVGPHSWKRWLHPPAITLWRARRTDDGGGFQVLDPPPEDPRPLAFFGARACDLAAIAVQDRVLMGGPHIDTGYARRREGLFVVAVQCGQAGGTCFCASMGTGPRATRGFDLALTELLDEAGHRFVVEVGTEAGAAVMAEVEHRPARADEWRASQAATARAEATQGRVLPDEPGVPALLMANLEHPRWDEVAERCLTCGNCTMVCPTCFCTTVQDTSDLAGHEAARVRTWDSCFTVDFTALHGGAVRRSGRSRYRQWLTHKLATWYEQFGSSGCVGCGRCITWCPVGIDLTEEVAAIRGQDAQAGRPAEEVS